MPRLTEEQEAEISEAQSQSARTGRPTVAKMEHRMHSVIPVLDQGFVRVVDYMGDDAAIVQAARVSYGKGTKKFNDDRSLLRYLMRHHHATPFEMCELKLHMKLPIFVARQLIRHRTASVNEYSARYSELADEFYIPVPSEVNLQGSSNRQGGDDYASDDVAIEAIETIGKLTAASYENYKKLLDLGISRELSRVVIPVDCYTQWYWKCDLRNLFHFLGLRLDSHAQYQIRVFAEAIADVVKDWVPLAWEAFDEYVLNARTFSKTELQILKQMLATCMITGTGTEQFHSLSKREQDEFYKKLGTIG